MRAVRVHRGVEGIVRGIIVADMVYGNMRER
jgi:hypothetical protein